MKSSNSNPFDSNKSISIENLTIENSEDKVILYVDLEITRDKKGLQKLEKLLTILEATKNKLESEQENLPENIEIKKSTVVKNPFRK